MGNIQWPQIFLNGTNMIETYHSATQLENRMDDQVSEELVMTKSPPALKHIDLSAFVVEIEVGMGGSKKQRPPPLLLTSYKS